MRLIPPPLPLQPGVQVSETAECAQVQDSFLGTPPSQLVSGSKAPDTSRPPERVCVTREWRYTAEWGPFNTSACGSYPIQQRLRVAPEGAAAAGAAGAEGVPGDSEDAVSSSSLFELEVVDCEAEPLVTVDSVLPTGACLGVGQERAAVG